MDIDNVGTDDQNVKLILKNSELDLDETRNFELERYGDEDSENFVFNFLIPDDIESDNYFIEAILEYSGKKESVKKEIYIECVHESISEIEQYANEFENEPIMINQAVEISEEEKSTKWTLTGMIAMMELLIIFGISVVIVKRI